MLLRVLLFLLLALAFSLLFIWLKRDGIIRNVLRRTYDTIDAAARKRVYENRRKVMLLNHHRGILQWLEQRLIYSGLVRRFPFLTPEMWILGNMAVSFVTYFGVILFTHSFLWGVLGIALLQLTGVLIISMLMGQNYRLVNDNLLKFLDFLGNYSITAGEVTGIFNQISKYMDEPLKSALAECYYEAQTSGDTSLALMAMAEKIEHPKFKELVRNIEISTRFSADFTVLVSYSRRAVREHLRTRQERKALVNEGFINMMILAGLSLVILLSVEKLINVSIWEILFHTLIGKVCSGIILIIFCMLYRQIRRLDR